MQGAHGILTSDSEVEGNQHGYPVDLACAFSPQRAHY